MDYAAESDVDTPRNLGVSTDKLHARTYHYEGEDECDRNAEITLRAIETASAEQGFAAVKVTALGQPKLLQHVSSVVQENKRLFRRYFIEQAASEGEVDPQVIAQAMTNGSAHLTDARTNDAMSSALKELGLGPGPFELQVGASVLAKDPYLATTIDRSKFHSAMSKCGVEVNSEQIDELFAAMDKDNSGSIDILEWTDFLTLQTLGRMPMPESVLQMQDEASLQPEDRVKLSHQVMMPGAPDRLSDEMVDRLENMLERARMLSRAASEAGVTIMFDAEQTYLQPAIDHVVLQMQQEFNTGETPVVFNTYQAYLRDCPRRVEIALRKAQRNGFKFGAKFVRGAYMVQERDRAKKHGYADPIQPDLEST